MNKALANTAIFVSAYIVLMFPTYLAYVDAHSTAMQAVNTESLHMLSFPFLLHLTSMLALCWICLVRGAIVGKSWLVLLPMIAIAFEFVPVLSTIPYIPTAYHLLAIIIGAVSIREHNHAINISPLTRTLR
jgi:hypothetical protein